MIDSSVQESRRDRNEESLPAFLSVSEAARLLRVDAKTLYRAFAAGELPGARKIRATLRISTRILLGWFEATGASSRRPRAQR